MRRDGDLPVFVQGAGRLKLALQASLSPASLRCKHPGALLDTLKHWSDSYLRNSVPAFGHRQSLAELGYVNSPLGVASAEQLTAVAQVAGLFTEEGVTQLRRACYQLEAGSTTSDWIISNRTRAATESSTLIREMMGSRAFLLAVSQIAGVPLVPHPFLRARSQVNYFYPRQAPEDKAQIGMWHTDGTSFVLNILLSDPGEYEGGEFVFFDQRNELFDVSNLDGHVCTSVVRASGDAVYLYGSRVFHGVRPVTAGRRMSLVLSFHCPYSSVDVNKFWHLASDDGVLRTIRPWFQLRRDLALPADEQYRRLGIEPITFTELAIFRGNNDVA
ncbi:2OG-Fe(II) oxygenase [Pseudomonas sp. MF6787]|uniref:2OG-Fe(II) oxygenase n=1 Tax=Pseudomonas sp. MF6787 TaxID=2797536 RepID=UPI0018E901CC|nr:2OG-Fe(II) oxygenase [Pseudomonas sp. MF6787]MBJ2262183.1 2OG-Fe(II) oxygenase [Pseudomonas sp. MF6787]